MGEREINRTDYSGSTTVPDPEGSAPRSVTVIVPTRNRLGKIGALLERLLAEPDQYEIVVVDDASTDNTPQLLTRVAASDDRVVAVLNESPLGSSRARLAGARRASGDLLVLLDDDVAPAPGLARGHLARHAGGSRRLVLGYMPTWVPDPLPRGAFATRLYAEEYEARCAEYEADPELIMTGLWMGNMSVGREVFLEAFDSGLVPVFPYRHEDRVLGIVLSELGVTGVFDRGLFAQHMHNRPLPMFLKDCYQQGLGREEIRRLYPQVLPEPSEDLYLRGLPGPLRQVFAATRHEPVRRVATGSLSAGIRGAGIVRARTAEMNLARLARKVEQLHGARDAARSAEDELA